MKILFFFLLCSISLSLTGQNLNGAWKIEDPSKEGKKAVIKFLIYPQGKFSLDIGSDGSIDIKGIYELDGDMMTVYDREGDNICNPKAKGVYKWKVDKTTLTMITVSEECDNRGAPVGESMVFTRMGK